MTDINFKVETLVTRTTVRTGEVTGDQAEAILREYLRKTLGVPFSANIVLEVRARDNCILGVDFQCEVTEDLTAEVENS